MGLRVGEGDPYFRYLIGGEKIGYVIDVGSQETHIAQVFGDGGFGAGPHAIAFDINPDIIYVGIDSCKSDGVIAFSAG